MGRDAPDAMVHCTVVDVAGHTSRVKGHDLRPRHHYNWCVRDPGKDPMIRPLTTALRLCMQLG